MRKYLYLARNSLRMLHKNMKRTLLTLLGIVVGTGVLVLVLSLGEGLESLIMNQLGSFSPNTLFVEVQTPPSSRAGIMGAYNIKTMDKKDLEDILTIDGIEYGSSWYPSTGKAKFNGEDQNIMILGVNANFPKVQHLPIEQGRFFNQAEDKSGEKVIVIGKALAEKLTDDRPQTLYDQKIKIENKSFRVIGITQDLDDMGAMNMSDMAFIPLKTGQNHLWADDHLQAIMLRIKDVNQVKRLSWRIQNIMRRNHDIDDPEDDDFAVRTFDQLMEIVGTVTSGVNLLLAALASISLLVGGVGIMNVMYVTVSERTKEIGLRKSIGARPSLIMMQFLFEALILTVLGGILGAILGTMLSWLISIGANYAGFQWTFSLPWTGIIGAILISSLIGIVFGITPARKAAHLEPISALRAEN